MSVRKIELRQVEEGEEGEEPVAEPVDDRFTPMLDGEVCPHCGVAVEAARQPGHIRNWRTGLVHEAHAEMTAAGPWGPAECIRVYPICDPLNDTDPDRGWDDWGHCDQVTCKRCIAIMGKRRRRTAR